MGWIKTILARVWALWAALLFVSTMLVFLIPFFLFCFFKKDPGRTSSFIRCSRVWMKIYLSLIGCPLTIRGREHFREGDTYIVLCNHNSLMDVPVSSPSIPGGNKTIAKAEMARIPVFGLLYKTGSVLVDRKSESSRRESIPRMKQILDMGLHMCIYPEGTRNRSGSPLKSFHNGAFRLAIDTRKAVIPALIFNTAKVLPAEKTFYAWPHRLAIHFLPPVQAQDGESADELRERIHEIMRSYYISQTGRN